MWLVFNNALDFNEYVVAQDLAVGQAREDWPDTRLDAYAGLLQAGMDESRPPAQTTAQDGSPESEKNDTTLAENANDPARAPEALPASEAAPASHTAICALTPYEIPTVSESIAAVLNTRSRGIGDEEFSRLLASAKVLAETVSAVQSISSGSATQSHPSFSALRLEIALSNEDARGRAYVPGGQIPATRLGISTAAVSATCVFPHVLAESDDGTSEFWCETNKHLVIRANLRECGSPGLVTGAELSNRLRATGSQTEPMFALRLKMDTRDSNGEYTDPVGTGPGKTFGTPIVDRSGLSQLLVPSERTDQGRYTKSLSNQGSVTFHTRLNNGVSSHCALPRGTAFVFEVQCLHPRLLHVRATSVPFKAAAKFGKRGHRLQRGEMYVESNGAVERVNVAPPRGKKRQHAGEAWDAAHELQ